MPGWKKNIPACLQPDQEGGKSGPGLDRACSLPHGPVSVGLLARVCLWCCARAVIISRTSRAAWYWLGVFSFFLISET